MGSPRKFLRLKLSTVPKTEVGSVYGRLTAIQFLEKVRGRNYWLLKCECGKEKRAADTDLRCGDTKSCGCLNAEMTKARETVHGGAGTYLFRLLQKMKERCTNPNCKQYKYYGARGISVSEEFYDFAIFRDYMHNDVGFDEKYVKANKLEIDRIDNNKGYERGNLRLVTHQENCNNRRNSPQYK